MIRDHPLSVRLCRRDLQLQPEFHYLLCSYEKAIRTQRNYKQLIVKTDNFQLDRKPYCENKTISATEAQRYQILLRRTIFDKYSNELIDLTQ